MCTLLASILLLYTLLQFANCASIGQHGSGLDKKLKILETLSIEIDSIEQIIDAYRVKQRLLRKVKADAFNTKYSVFDEFDADPDPRKFIDVLNASNDFFLALELASDESKYAHKYYSTVENFDIPAASNTHKEHDDYLVYTTVLNVAFDIRGKNDEDYPNPFVLSVSSNGSVNISSLYASEFSIRNVFFLCSTGSVDSFTLHSIDFETSSDMSRVLGVVPISSNNDLYLLVLTSGRLIEIYKLLVSIGHSTMSEERIMQVESNIDALGGIEGLQTPTFDEATLPLKPAMNATLTPKESRKENQGALDKITFVFAYQDSIDFGQFIDLYQGEENTQDNSGHWARLIHGHHSIGMLWDVINTSPSNINTLLTCSLSSATQNVEMIQGTTIFSSDGIQSGLANGYHLHENLPHLDDEAALRGKCIQETAKREHVYGTAIDKSPYVADIIIGLSSGELLEIKYNLRMLTVESMDVRSTVEYVTSDQTAYGGSSRASRTGIGQPINDASSTATLTPGPCVRDQSSISQNKFHHSSYRNSILGITQRSFIMAITTPNWIRFQAANNVSSAPTIFPCSINDINTFFPTYRGNSTYSIPVSNAFTGAVWDAKEPTHLWVSTALGGVALFDVLGPKIRFPISNSTVSPKVLTTSTKKEDNKHGSFGNLYPTSRFAEYTFSCKLIDYYPLLSSVLHSGIQHSESSGEEFYLPYLTNDLSSNQASASEATVFGNSSPLAKTTSKRQDFFLGTVPIVPYPMQIHPLEDFLLISSINGIALMNKTRIYSDFVSQMQSEGQHFVGRLLSIDFLALRDRDGIIQFIPSAEFNVTFSSDRSQYRQFNTSTRFPNHGETSHLSQPRVAHGVFISLPMQNRNVGRGLCNSNRGAVCLVYLPPGAPRFSPIEQWQQDILECSRVSYESPTCLSCLRDSVTQSLVTLSPSNYLKSVSQMQQCRQLCMVGHFPCSQYKSCLVKGDSKDSEFNNKKSRGILGQVLDAIPEEYPEDVEMGADKEKPYQFQLIETILHITSHFTPHESNGNASSEQERISRPSSNGDQSNFRKVYYRFSTVEISAPVSPDAVPWDPGTITLVEMIQGPLFLSAIVVIGYYYHIKQRDEELITIAIDKLKEKTFYLRKLIGLLTSSERDTDESSSSLGNLSREQRDILLRSLLHQTPIPSSLLRRNRASANDDFDDEPGLSSGKLEGLLRQERYDAMNFAFIQENESYIEREEVDYYEDRSDGEEY